MLAGVCNILLEEVEDVPVLGVCFGMQALAHVHGGRVLPAPEPIHGRLSGIQHSGHPLFAGIPSGKGQMRADFVKCFLVQKHGWQTKEH